MMLKIITISLSLMVCFVARAQTCSCPEYDAFYAGSNPQDSELFYAQLGQSKNQYCIAKFSEWRANRYTSIGEYDSAELLLIKADRIYNNCPEAERINYYKYKAGLFYAKGDFSKSMEWSLRFLNAAESADNAYEIAVCNTMIAQLFNQMGQADRGIVYTRKAVSFLTKIKPTQKREEILFKISKRYLWHFQDFNIKSSLDSCEIFAVQQLQLAKQLAIPSKISMGYNNLQGVAFEKKDFNLCLTYLDSASLYIDKEDFDNLAINFYDRADILLQLKKYKEAKQYADSALIKYKEGGFPAYIADAYGLISEIHRNAGDYEQALNSYRQQNAIIDSLANAEKAAAFNELEKKYNQEKNVQEIRDLTQQRTIYLLLSLILLLSVLGAFIFFRQKSLRQKQLILETEQRLNRARMNPHFFFNTLSSLQRLALSEKDGLKIASSLSQFSQVMRKSLESTYEDMISVEAEMNFLEQYLQVQKARFSESFTFSVVAAHDLEVNELALPSMMIQPFVENSIEHGLTGLDYDGVISILFSKSDSELIVEIKDNGRGIADQPNKKNHTSRATEIIKDRIYLLNQYQKSNARFEVLENEQGIKILLYLPLMRL
jgi:tetratricopeptide (TPR) repeat protein